MREEFLEFLARVNQKTTLDELAQYCQTDEELALSLKKAGETPCVREELPDEW